jgi:nucleotide-binding universal stress UspA family protein
LGADRAWQPQTAVTDLGLKVRKVVTESEHPVQGVLHYMERHPPDLIVLKTTVNDGRMQWFRQSEAKPLSLKSGQISLILPSGVDGFVSAQDGSFQLNQVLIPVAHDPDPTAAVNAAVRFAVRTAAPTGTFHLLHIGSDPEDAPRVDPPEVPGWVWKRSIVPGPVVDTIAQVAREDGADLIIMATNGRDGFLDALRGSHSERLLHKTPCPIATIPEGSNLRFELGG